jgi:hypothetical protein
MPAVTPSLIALAGAGASAVQAVQSQKENNLAKQSINKSLTALRSIKESNAFKNVQVPTLGFELAKESQAQNTAQFVNALMGTGAEGVLGGIGNVAAATNEQDQALAAQANQAQYARDMAQAEAQQGINARGAERDFLIGANELQGEQLRRTAAEARRNQAIQSAFTALGTASVLGAETIPLYKENKLAAEKAAAIAGMPESITPLGADITSDQLQKARGTLKQLSMPNVGFGPETLTPEFIKLLSSLKIDL